MVNFEYNRRSLPFHFGDDTNVTDNNPWFLAALKEFNMITKRMHAVKHDYVLTCGLTFGELCMLKIYLQNQKRTKSTSSKT